MDARGRGPHLVAVVDAKDDSDYDDSVKPTVDIMAAEIVKGNTYSCLALKPAKGKETDESDNKTEYSFNISKADHIFDHLLKDKQIRLLDGQFMH